MIRAWMLVALIGAFGCGDDAQAPNEGTQAGDCSDGADNDGDGLFDCLDPGCAGSPTCGTSDGGGIDSAAADGGTPDAPIVRRDAGSEMPCESDAECAMGLVCSGNICRENEVGDCAIAECSMGSAVSCDGSVTLDCNQFGGSCQAFSDGENDFSWCGCGGLATGEGSCTGTRDGYACEDGITLLLECPAGSTCDDSDGVVGCVCDGLDDGVCPAMECIEDPDCGGCTPNCGGNTCGDNGCGGSCGSCGLGQSCSAGSCVSSCTPSCDGRVCASNGCGGTCGSCDAPDTCNAASGRCESECVPSCDPGQVCGSDGCGGTCGSICPADRECRRCPSGSTCAVESYDCRCSFFDRVTYEFDGTGIDWTDINFIALNVNHYAEDGIRATTRGALLTVDDTRDTYNVLGCEADIGVRRSYAMRGGVTCEFTDRVNRSNIVIPQPTLMGGSCTAPSL